MKSQPNQPCNDPFGLTLAQVAHLELGELNTEPFGRIGEEFGRRLAGVGERVLVIDQRAHAERLARVEAWLPDAQVEGDLACLFVLCDVSKDAVASSNSSVAASLISILARARMAPAAGGSGFASTRIWRPART